MDAFDFVVVVAVDNNDIFSSVNILVIGSVFSCKKCKFCFVSNSNLENVETHYDVSLSKKHTTSGSNRRYPRHSQTGQLYSVDHPF